MTINLAVRGRCDQVRVCLILWREGEGFPPARHRLLDLTCRIEGVDTPQEEGIASGEPEFSPACSEPLGRHLIEEVADVKANELVLLRRNHTMDVFRGSYHSDYTEYISSL